MAIFPTAVSTDSDLYVAVNATGTQLTDNPLSAGATTVNVVSTTGFPSVGFISIDLEIIKYTGVTATSFTGCTRASDGTSASAHVQNSQVYHNVIAGHHNALKDEIKAIEQNLSDRIGLGSTQLKTPDGTSSLPAHSFASEPDCGMYISGTNEVAFVAGTNVAFYATTSGLQATGTNLRGGNGTAALPFFTFTSDPDTGIYSIGLNQLGLAAGGSLIARAELNGGVAQFLLGSGTLAAPSLCIAGNATHGFYRVTGLDVTGSSVPLAPTSGTASSCGIQFDGDPNTGILRNGADNISIVAGGSEYVNLTSSGASVILVNGTAATPALRFAGDTNTGIYAPGTADRLDISVGGSTVVQFQLNAAVPQTLFGSGTSTAPSICIAGNATHGFYRVAGLDITGSSVPLAPPTGSAANPTYTFATDTNTGMYSSGGDVLNLSVGGSQCFQLETTSISFTFGVQSFVVDNNATAGNTRLRIYDVDNATVERVSVGAADSGGAGFKVLRIPN